MTMNADTHQMYLVDFGQSGAYVFEADSRESADHRTARVNEALRHYIQREYPDFDFNILTRAHARRLTPAEAEAHAGWPRLDAGALRKIAADSRNEAASGAATRELNNGSPWSGT